MKLLSPKILLHLEGLVVLAASCAAYAWHGSAWWKFAVLFLAPDLMMVGYLFSTKAGAAVYNLGHTYLAVGALGLIGYFLHWPAPLPVCLIWLAHIGFDRMLDFGLKYPTTFKATHFGQV